MVLLQLLSLQKKDSARADPSWTVSLTTRGARAQRYQFVHSYVQPTATEAGEPQRQIRPVLFPPKTTAAVKSISLLSPSVFPTTLKSASTKPERYLRRNTELRFSHFWDPNLHDVSNITCHGQKISFSPTFCFAAL